MNEESDSTQQGMEPGMGHLLGIFEVPDARRLLPALETRGVEFEIEEDDEIETANSRGSYGRTAKLRIWINECDQEKAERVQQEALGIQA